MQSGVQGMQTVARAFALTRLLATTQPQISCFWMRGTYPVWMENLLGREGHVLPQVHRIAQTSPAFTATSTCEVSGSCRAAVRVLSSPYPLLPFPLAACQALLQVCGAWYHIIFCCSLHCCMLGF